MPPAMDVERVAEVPLAHRGAFDVPARPAAPERSIPRRAEAFVARLRLLPQRKVAHRLLVIFVRRHASTGFEPGAIEMREGAIRRKARDPEIDVPVGDIRVLVLDQGR